MAGKWEPRDQNSFFEFRIETDEITGGLSLLNRTDPDANQDEANDITLLCREHGCRFQRSGCK